MLIRSLYGEGLLTAHGIGLFHQTFGSIDADGRLLFRIEVHHADLFAAANQVRDQRRSCTRQYAAYQLLRLAFVSTTTDSRNLYRCVEGTYERITIREVIEVSFAHLGIGCTIGLIPVHLNRAVLIVDRIEFPSGGLDDIVTVDNQESVTITCNSLEVEEFRVVDGYVQRVDGIALRCRCGNCIVVQTGLVVVFTILCPFILVTLRFRFYNRIINRIDDRQIKGYNTIAACCSLQRVAVIAGSRVGYMPYLRAGCHAWYIPPE